MQNKGALAFIQTRVVRKPVIRQFGVVVVFLMLAACQTLPEPALEKPAEPQWLNDPAYFEQAQRNYQKQNTWRYAAKVGLTTPELRETANIVWEYSDQANTVRLFGPLGIGAVRLQFDDYGVVLSDNKGVLHRGDSAERLLTDIVGWPIPIDALGHWLFTLPDPRAVYRYRLNENEQLAKLEQLGWQIEYSMYKPYAGQILPRKVVATKLTAGLDAPAVTVKLITKTWQW